MCKRTTPAIQTFICIDSTNTSAFQTSQIILRPAAHCRVLSSTAKSPQFEALSGAHHMSEGAGDTLAVPAREQRRVTASAPILLPELRPGRKAAAKEVRKLSGVPANSTAPSGKGDSQGQARGSTSPPPPGAACWAAPLDVRTLL